MRGFYSTADEETAQEIVQKFDVRYVVLGDLERATHPNADHIADFLFLEPVFKGPTTVFQVRGRAMKILMVLTYYHPHWTGLTAYAKRLAEGLAGARALRHRAHLAARAGAAARGDDRRACASSGCPSPRASRAAS